MDRTTEHVTCNECKRKEDCTSRTTKVNYADLQRIQQIINGKGLLDLGEVNDILNKYI